MYGDLVNGLCYTAFLPVYLWMSLKNPSSQSLQICAAFAWTTVFSWYSYWTNSSRASMMAIVGMSASIAGMNLYRWPHADEVVVVPQFLWSLLIISANAPLSFAYRMTLAVIALSTAVLVAIYTPLLRVSDALPLLLGASTMHSLFHYYATSESREIVSAHGASLILAGTFAFHMSSEIVSMITLPKYAMQGGYSILKAGFFAAVGLAAAGAFRKEINVKEALEVLVQQRTKEIQKQSEQLRVVELALQASETAIAITDSKQRIVWSNAALERISGLEIGEMQSRTLMETLRPSKGNISQSMHLRDDLLSYHEELIVSGSYIHAEISPFPGKNKDEEPLFLFVLKDVTAQRAREIAEQAVEQEAMKTKAMAESIETLSHELRTPLQGIMGVTSLLIDDSELPKNTTDALSLVMTSARLLLTLINNILDVRKMDAAMLDEFHLDPIQLSKSLSDAADFCQPFAMVSDVKLETDNLESIQTVIVESNALRLQQVMINLISNAIKYTAVGSAVVVNAKLSDLATAKRLRENALARGPHQHVWDTLSMEQTEGTKVAIVSVSDAGQGITEGQAARLFGKFCQLDNKTTSGKKAIGVGQPSGTGLGLNLCLKFIQRMKGNIWVSNNPNGGSCFSFYIPLAIDIQNRDVNSPMVLTTDTTCRTSSHGSGHHPGDIMSAAVYHVLVVDDTLINLKVIERMLHRIGITETTCVNSGAHALDALAIADYDLVLTDIQMPEMSGVQLCKLIRSSTTFRIPVVVGLTADTSETMYEKCKQAGMAHVLYKPITKDHLQDFFVLFAERLIKVDENENEEPIVVDEPEVCSPEEHRPAATPAG